MENDSLVETVHGSFGMTLVDLDNQVLLRQGQTSNSL